jgi:hypothetical protein
MMPNVVVNLPAGPALARPFQVRSIWRRAVRLLKSIVARIDLSDFPPSCCG